MYESVSDPRIVEDVGAEDQKVANLRNSGVMRPIPLPITILSRGETAMKMNLRIILLLAGVLLIVSNTCALAHTDVTAEQARELIASTDDLTVVDVREPYEYCGARGHIPGALSYPWSSGVLEARYEELSTDDPVLVVCQSGGRSNAAASSLDSKGFSEVYDMLRGMSAWQWETAPCKYSGGSGTPDNPYQIATAEDLNEIGSNEDDWDKHFVVTEDIDLSAYLGPQFNRIGRYPQDPFVGSFDGMNHAIRNFTWIDVDGGCNYVALFANLGTGGHIRNLALENVDVDCPGKGDFVSALVARNHAGAISNCSVSGRIAAGRMENIGAIVGYSNGGSIDHCHVEVDVSGSNRVGGLAGYCEGTSISNCHAVISVLGGTWTGGLIGRSQYDCSISGCSTTGSVSGGSQLGGLIGNSRLCTITDCMAEVEIAGAGYVGGLIGISSRETITNCSASGQVRASGSYVGGLIGGISKVGEVTGCHATGDVSSAKGTVGGLIGSVPAAATVSRCSATGDVSGQEKLVGGLVGYSTGTITESYATGSVNSSSRNAGGLLGSNNGTIENSYATGNVTATGRWAGGLSGYKEGTAINCYATGRVSGGEGTCALIGQNSGGWVVDCFWDTETSGWNSCPNGDGKSTAEMMDPDTFLPWACSTPGVWTIDPHRDYPRLAWQLSVGELIDTPEPGSLYGGGTGDPNDPYLIATAKHLWRIGMYRCDWDRHFTLVADIDLTDYSGQTFRRIGKLRSKPDNPANLPFTGVFDGDNHTIGQFKLSDANPTEVTGFFGWLGEEGRIKNLVLRDIAVNGGGDLVGGLVGKSEGTISNCRVTGSISGQAFVGGLVGRSEGTISNCCVTGGISGSRIVGGLVGEIAGGEVSYCQLGVDVLSEHECSGGLAGLMNTGTISYCCVTASNISGRLQTAGLAGVNNQGIIECSWASCNISGTYTLGGIAGKNWQAVIRRCYATGQIAGEKGGERRRVGGLVGWNLGGSTIEDCFASASVVGWTVMGGLVGRNDGTIHNTYATGNVPGSSCEPTSYIGCIVGNCKNPVTNSFWDRDLCPLSCELLASCGAEGKTSSEMRDIGTFRVAGWDFSDTWYMPDDGYPQLILFEGAGTPEDPYQLATAWQLAIVGSQPILADRHYILINDIDLDPDLPTGQVFDRAVISEFSGIFDGNDHVIRNLRIEGDSNLGLFGVLYDTATVRNLHIMDANVAGTGSNIGILAGENQGNVSRCDTTGVVAGDWNVGGLVGLNEHVVTESYSTSAVRGRQDVGGLVGHNAGGDLWHCYGTGQVEGQLSVGGVVGRNGIWTDPSGGQSIGGQIVNSYFAGLVVADEAAGGLVGRSDVESGVVGSFWDVETSGESTSDGGTGLTTSEMQTASTFLEAGWDFMDETANGTEDIWWILEGQDYPRLWWEASGP